MRLDVPAELKAAFPPRPAAADKYSVGTVAVVGGSANYPHAPVLAALGARAAGAGLVRLSVPPESRFAAAVHVPEATLALREAADADLPRADAAAFGMGLGRSSAAEALLDGVLADDRYARIVLDADALSLLAGRGRLAPRPGQARILTPHLGEAERLLGWPRGRIEADRPAAARALAARYGACVVLKGPGTLVLAAEGTPTWTCPAGNPYMAIGGMGDVLAGAVAARWAYLRGTAFAAAAGAVWLHAVAADRLVAAGEELSLVAVAAEMGRLRVGVERLAEANF